MNGQQVISTATYKYGETAVVPKNPSKLSDDRFSYTFVGWTDDDFTVTSDKTYRAV